MPGITIPNLIFYGVFVALQIVMFSFLPATRGYTNLIPTLICLASANLANFLFSRILVGGSQLSFLVPLTAALVPLSVVAVAIFFYGEPAPPLKLVLLVIACGMIGVASAIR